MSDENNTTPQHDARYAGLLPVQKMKLGKQRSAAERDGAVFDESSAIDAILAEGTPPVAPTVPSEQSPTPGPLPASPVTTANVVPPGTPPPSERINLSSTSPVGGANPTTIEQQGKTLKQIAAEAYSIENRKWYNNYPAIRGGKCEYDGLDYRKSPFYKRHYDRLGKFICLCGRSGDEHAMNQLTLLYVPHRSVFVCDSAGCEQLYFQRYGGFEKRISWHFFRREIPYYGSLLQDVSESAEKATALG